MRTLEQIRADFAWKRVNDHLQALIVEAKKHIDDDEKAANHAAKEFGKYRNLAKSMPALVMTNGLMQTLAFLKGKADKSNRNEHDRLLAHVLEWLREVKVIVDQQVDFAKVMNWCADRERTTLEYQRATEETQAILRWIRQLADTL
jgi:CRISPR-associated protein Cmr5